MSFKLRDYQITSIEAVKNMKKGYKGIIALPTGSGKTILMAAIANSIEGRVLIVVQSSELREQTIEKLKIENKDLDVGSVQASLDDVHSKIVIATRQSLTHAKSNRMQRMSEYGDFELIFFDEAHNACFQIKKIMNKLDNDNIKVIGLTATPFNEDMNTVFDGIIYEKPILEMIQSEYLCEPKAIYVHSDTDLSNIKTLAGEFNQKQLEETINTDNRNKIIVDAYIKHASDRKSTLVFASGIDHCRDICQEFQDNNILCEYVDSTIDDNLREKRISDFKNNKINVLVNVGILTTGFDYEPVDCIIYARPTKSKILYTQILGRGLRPFKTKIDCLVIDVVDVCRKHDIQSMTDVFNVDIKNGETLKEAIEREKKNEHERIEREHIQKAKEQERLKLVAEQLKLFKTNMGDYFNNAYYDWFKCDKDIYVLSTFSDMHYAIYKNILENCFQLYNINTSNGINSKYFISEDDNLANLIDYAHTLANRKYSTYLDRKAMWKHESATQKQIEWLSKEWWAQGKRMNTKMDIHILTKGNKIQWIIKKKEDIIME